jgi:hypothetical protein
MVNFDLELDEIVKKKHRIFSQTLSPHPEMDSVQTAMGLPPVTSAVFLIVKSLLK